MIVQIYASAALIALAILAVMFTTLHRDYYVRLTRHHLFRIRAGLFVAAKNAGLSHSHPGYVLVRKSLNGMIRFSEDLSLFQLASIIFVNTFLHRNALTNYKSEFNRATHDMSAAHRALLLHAQGDAHHVILRHVMSTSCLLWPILKPLSICLAFLEKTETARRWIMKKAAWKRFDAEATFFPPNGASA